MKTCLLPPVDPCRRCDKASLLPSSLFPLPFSFLPSFLPSALVVIALLAGYGDASGQVTIKQRVEIRDEVYLKVDHAANSSSVGAPVAPFDGVVRVTFYGPAHRFITQFATSDSVAILLNGVEKSRTAVLDHYTLNSSILSNCGGNGTYYGYTVPGITSTWLPIPVSEGDTLDFADGVGQALFSQQSDSVWDSSLEAICNQNVYYSRIPFGVEIVRDSVQLEFVTAPGDTLPEPGTHITARAIVKGAGGDGNVRFEIANHDYPDPANAPDTLIWFLVGNDTLATPQVVSMDVDTAEVTLISKAYWGAVDVTAKYFVGTDSTSGRTERWPDDVDEDGIADLWEMSLANGASLNLGTGQLPGCTGVNDNCWDEDENSDTIQAGDGDGLSKLVEYQGILAGSHYIRLSPIRQEVFIDTSYAMHADWAADQIAAQLDLDVYKVSGNVVNQIYPGSKRLRILGLSGVDQERNYIPVKDRPKWISGSSPRRKVENGLVVVNGIFSADGSSVSGPKCLASPFDCQPSLGSPEYGETNVLLSHGRVGNSTVYDSTIFNIWNSNSIPEAAIVRFRYPVPVPTGGNVDGVLEYDARYRLLDINKDGDNLDYINPFELLSYGALNDSHNDGLIAGLSQQEYWKLVTLHEMGHALGIAANCSVSNPRYGCHPLSGSSVMRSGFGPAKIVSFSPTDKGQVSLK